MRTYQDTWNHRCKILFCCMGRSDQYQVCLHDTVYTCRSILELSVTILDTWPSFNQVSQTSCISLSSTLFCTRINKDSFSEIARLLTDFFRDLDLVPTDIVAGLVLLRKQQKKLQETLVTQVIKTTRHLIDMSHNTDVNRFERDRHYDVLYETVSPITQKTLGKVDNSLKV